MPFITRRRILAGALIVILCAMVTSCGAPGAGSDTRNRRRGSGAQPVAPAVADHRVRTGESVLQIVAHPDDDLYFMNPDVNQSLASGRPLTTVYLTAGQADGVNAPRGRPRALSPRTGQPTPRPGRTASGPRTRG